jgi:hypothetical protein
LTLLVAGMALVVPAAVFPAYWETGTLGQHRTISSAYFVFLVLWFAAVPAMLVAWPRRGDALRACSERWRTTLGILLIAALALTRNSYALGSDFLSGRLAGFERAMSNRFARLQACHDGGESPCEVDQLRDPPASFITTDVAADSGNWVNAAYARYFGIPEVRGRRAASSEHVRD